MKKITVFNPENKEQLTYGECLDPIFKITGKQDAIQYKDAYLKYTEKFLINGHSETRLTALEIVNTNIGYYAGYGSNEDRKRIEELFECSHPIFGSVKQNGVPTGKEAFRCGNEHKTLNEVRS